MTTTDRTGAPPEPARGGDDPSPSARTVVLVYDVIAAEPTDRAASHQSADHAIRAFVAVARMVPNAKLRIRGAGREVDALRKTAVELGLDDQVEM